MQAAELIDPAAGYDPSLDLIALEDRLEDREWRIDNLYMIENKYGDTIQFVRNESQKAFWDEMWFLNMILKDRQRGFSTLIAIFILDYCLFNSGTKAGIIDITLTDAKKKLGKIQFAYDRLPLLVKEMYPQKTENKEEVEWHNGSSVFVGTSHRGGTLQLLHLSEMGSIAVRFPERAREIRTGALNTVAPGNIVFNESTAMGNAGEFFDDCQLAQKSKERGDKLTLLDYRFHFFAWWMGTENELDPEGVFISRDNEKYFDELVDKVYEEMGIELVLTDRKKAWYAKKESQQKDDMKREFPGTPAEAFEAAIEGAYLSKQMVGLQKAGQITVVPFEPALPINTGWDFGLGDNMTIWFHQLVGLQHRIINYLFGSDDDVTYYWAEMNRMYPNALWGNHFLPHDAGYRRIGTANDAASPPKTLQTIMGEAGMSNTHIVPKIDDKWTAIQEVKLFLPKVYIDEKNCDEGLNCLRQFRREWDDKNGCWKNKPRHDWAMHGYDGMESLIRGLGAYGSKTEKKMMTKLPPPSNWRAR